MDSLYIVMPAYNEEETIKDIVHMWYPYVERAADESRLVVADSGSTDSTHSILLELQKELPRLKILEGTLKQHGPKLIALYKYAIKKNADYIFQTDSDGQTNPEEFEEFWEDREKYDAIVGYRPVRGDGRSRAFVENVVCILLRIFFGVKVPDANAPFRLMTGTLVEKYINRLNDDFNIPNIMLTTYLVYYKENISFREITFRPRLGGVSSINIKKIVKIGLKAVGDFIELKKEM